MEQPMKLLHIFCVICTEWSNLRELNKNMFLNIKINLNYISLIVKSLWEGKTIPAFFICKDKTCCKLHFR